MSENKQNFMAITSSLEAMQIQFDVLKRASMCWWQWPEGVYKERAAWRTYPVSQQFAIVTNAKVDKQKFSEN